MPAGSFLRFELHDGMRCRDLRRSACLHLHRAGFVRIGVRAQDDRAFAPRRFACRAVRVRGRRRRLHASVRSDGDVAVRDDADDIVLRR